MALSAPALGEAITADLVAAGALPPLAAPLGLAIAISIVTHIQQNAVVLPLALIAPTGGGPVTGTGTVE